MTMSMVPAVANAVLFFPGPQKVAPSPSLFLRCELVRHGGRVQQEQSPIRSNSMCEEAPEKLICSIAKCGWKIREWSYNVAAVIPTKPILCPSKRNTTPVPTKHRKRHFSFSQNTTSTAKLHAYPKHPRRRMPPLINQNNNNCWGDDHYTHHCRHRPDYFHPDSSSSSSTSSDYDWPGHGPRRWHPHPQGAIPTEVLVHQALMQRDRDMWERELYIRQARAEARAEEEEERRYREIIVLGAKMEEEKKKREEEEKLREVIATWKRKEEEKKAKREREMRDAQEAVEERILIDILMERAGIERW
jgi:hypothetical protein